MRITITCVVDRVRYSKVIELDQVPLVGDTVTVWQRVFKNKSKKPANGGITLQVQSRNWDNRDGGVELRCDGAGSTIMLIQVGFK